MRDPEMKQDSSNGRSWQGPELPAFWTEEADDLDDWAVCSTTGRNETVAVRAGDVHMPGFRGSCVYFIDTRLEDTDGYLYLYLCVRLEDRQTDGDGGGGGLQLAAEGVLHGAVESLARRRPFGCSCRHVTYAYGLGAVMQAQQIRSPAAAMSSSEVACTYAALILHDDGIPITAEKIATVVKAANIKVESYWPALFAKLLEKRSVDDLILSVGSGGGAAPVAAAAAPAAGADAAAPAAEEKKEEAKEESDDDMGFSLFD
ncbi:hypothetical protein PR202_ga30877 [Eleusine coracana subsp. coracana]|uniref:60S acidic ribosomal protein P1 n=1 Tax=Eleusine coracana subsp. coracana TaxID=191504 RepID=A0AAV5DPX9_ELECO|nr:hypothetical protein PR202_ga30877 [Eleusine coracana subsp. coracana]